MFSVIIPTMWYSDKIHRNLSNLNDCDKVGEIILIDNNPSLKPKEIPYDKVRYITKGTNIYVNPAWNLGVEEAKWDNICISNDDINFNTDIFQFIEPHLSQGIWGMSSGNYYGIGKEKEYQIQPITQRPWGWGCLLFLNKKNWIPIHKRLMIACGDDWLLHHLGGGEILNFDLGSDEISKTSLRSEFFNIQEEDIELWSQYLHSHTKDITY